MKIFPLVFQVHLLEWNFVQERRDQNPNIAVKKLQQLDAISTEMTEISTPAHAMSVDSTPSRIQQKIKGVLVEFTSPRHFA